MVEMVVIGGAFFLVSIAVISVTVVSSTAPKSSDNTSYFLGFRGIAKDGNTELMTPAWYRIVFCLYLIVFSALSIANAYRDPVRASIVITMLLVGVTIYFCYRNYQIITKNKGEKKC